MKKKLLYGILMIISVFTYTSCSNAGDYVPNTPDEVQKVIYSELFADTLGGFTAVDVSGTQKWAIEKTRKYAYMSGFINPTNYANEDWLISPEINLTDVTTAHFSFDHVARYFTDPMNDATVWITDNYSESAPTTNWTQLHITPFTDPGSYTFGSSGQISLTAYTGKKVRIAFKYVSTATKAGTWEVKNFSVSSGEAVVVNNVYGAGTEENPYTVLGAIENQSNKLAWVKGYIVGYVWYANKMNTFYFSSDTCTQKTNLLIADSLGGFYLSQCAAVQLPVGAVRNGINLSDNKSLIGKKVTLYGSLTPYFGITGVKNTSFYKLEDGTSGGTKPFDPANAIFYETFATGLGLFTSQNVTGAEVWVYNSTYKCAYITGFVSSQNRENEDWLISPQIDLTGKSSPAMCFDHVVRYAGVPANEATVWVSLNYTSGLPSTATWTQIPTNFTNASSWDFYNSGDMSLSAYANKKIRIAIKYVSTTTKAGTWEMKNFIVK